MCDNNTLNIILSKTVDKFKATFQTSLKSVILYGSYARGDYDSESDIDVVALVDMDRAELNKYFNDMAKFSSDIDLEYGIMLSPSIVPFNDYNKYKNDLPYYSNIATEGVVLSA